MIGYKASSLNLGATKVEMHFYQANQTPTKSGKSIKNSKKDDSQLLLTSEEILEEKIDELVSELAEKHQFAAHYILSETDIEAIAKHKPTSEGISSGL